ncbi:hypothetical protein JCGZ_00374 [Jatropha curcas]|uniref:Uncharacterized protein n=1 Tax=Jatropha curcas TaxID=180498 RepID=A0A067JG31_JATCU|nr:uncharacterized protein LOC105648053 [Jatropha curcas]KDP22787.1 hypothetical protein JCGZ_00374 [Jatropha curcas]
MLSTSSSEIAPKSLQIKEDDKFFSRLLSKESSNANPSFRVYYGGVNVAVPFIWESQPGTPKYSFTQNTLLIPPLTPPPSFYSKCYSKKNKKPSNNNSRSHNLFYFVLSRIKKVTNMSKSPSSSSVNLSPTSSSSAASWCSLNSSSFLHSTHDQRSRFLSFDSRACDEEVVTIDQSPTSTLCFGASTNRKVWW